MVSPFSRAERLIYVTSATIVHENVEKKEGAPILRCGVESARSARADGAASLSERMGNVLL